MGKPLPKVLAKARAAKAAAEEPEAAEAPREEAPAAPVFEEYAWYVAPRVNAVRRVLRWAIDAGGWRTTHVAEHRLNVSFHVARMRQHVEERKAVTLTPETTPKELARILMELE